MLEPCSTASNTADHHELDAGSAKPLLGREAQALVDEAQVESGFLCLLSGDHAAAIHAKPGRSKNKSRQFPAEASSSNEWFR